MTDNFDTAQNEVKEKELLYTGLDWYIGVDGTFHNPKEKPYRDCLYELALACKDKSEQLLRKNEECERLCKGYAELTDIVAPYMDDFTGYNEELGGFDLILCIKQLLHEYSQSSNPPHDSNKQITKIEHLIEFNCKMCKEFDSKNCVYCNYDKILKITKERNI